MTNPSRSLELSQSQSQADRSLCESAQQSLPLAEEARSIAYAPCKTYGNPSQSGADRQVENLGKRSASGDKPIDSAASEKGVNRQQLDEIIRKLKEQGQDTAILDDLAEQFEGVDFDHDGNLSIDEVRPLIESRIVIDLQDTGRFSDRPWQKGAAQAEAVLGAGIGGEFAAKMALDSYSKIAEWKRNNPEAGLETWQYAVGPLFLGDTLRQRLDAGLDVQQMKEMREFIDAYGDDRFSRGTTRYYQNAVPPLLKDAIDIELHTPKSVDKNADGKIDSHELLTWGAEYRYHVDLNHLDQNAMGALGIAIADSVPNPEWPFFEDLGWAKQGAFESADKNHDRIVDHDEMNSYFKSEVWRKFDFREDCFQHIAKPDSVTLADVHWAQESADGVALADAGGREAALLVADAMKGIESRWSKYASDGSGRIKDELTVEQYSNALKTEVSLALLERFNAGVPCSNLNDYSDIASGLQKQFNISDEAFLKLVRTIKAASIRPTQYDTNGDGIVSAEELWRQTPQE